MSRSVLHLFPLPVASAAVWLRPIPTLHLLSVCSVCRNSFASTWPPPTTSCTIPPSTWPRRPPYPTWAWTWTWRLLWDPCRVNPTTRPCPKLSRCGAVLSCRAPVVYRPSTAKPQASKTCVWGPSSMLHHSAWTRYQTDHRFTQINAFLPSTSCVQDLHHISVLKSTASMAEWRSLDNF